MIALQTPELIQRVEQLAHTTAMDEVEVVEMAVQQYLDQMECEKIHAETEAFRQMYADLQTQYRGEYVAIHQGEVVDHDQDVLQLEQRVVTQLGDIAVLLAPVTASTRRDLRHISFRLEALT